MSASSANTAEQKKGSRRLIWLLVFLLLLVGALNIALSSLLPGAIQRWLHERGLEANIEHLELSLPRLRAGLRGVQVRNQQGRGFNARQATLGLSWWHLLQGEIHVNLVELEGVHFDLESLPGKRGRVWEIGGWLLKEGERKEKNWRVDLDEVRLRDAVLCYQHKPQWPTASCAQIDELDVEDLSIAGRRQGRESLQFSLTLDELYLRNLLAWDEKPDSGDAGQGAANTAPAQEAGEGDMRKSGREHPTVVISRLKISDGQFQRPGNRITADHFFTRKFAGCPPRRWAEAVPGLKRIVGHCASTRRLELKGPLAFSFGKKAEVALRRATGQEVRLRYANRRLPNWRAETIAINVFDYQREDQKLTWQSAGSTGFSWCPSSWRDEQHHYCIRAGSLRLPLPTDMAWGDGFDFATREAVLQQGTVLDLEQKAHAKQPLNVHQLQLAAITYTGASRRLGLQGVAVDSVAGCIPGQLWESPDQCVQLTRLAAPEEFAVEFPSRVRGQRLGVSSGPFAVDYFRLAPAGAPRDSIANDLLRVKKLHWARSDLSSADALYLLQDFGAQQLAGCIPQRWLQPREDSRGDLCVQGSELQGDGSFSLRTGKTSHLILGELRVDRLALTDHLSDADKPVPAVVLSQLQVGRGVFRHSTRNLVDGEEPLHLPLLDQTLATTDGSTVADEGSDDTMEKGRLDDIPAEGAGESTGGATAGSDRADGAVAVNGDVAVDTEAVTEAELETLSLSRMDGCLPASWRHLFYRDARRGSRPECFDVRNLRQHRPMNLILASESSAGGSGRLRFHFDAAALTLEKASITSTERKFLDVAQLRVPRADISLITAPTRARVRLPQLAVDRASFCLEPQRCINATMVRTGEHFALDYSPRTFTANFNDLVLNQFELSGPPSAFTARVDSLVSLQLQARLPRQPGARADWQMRNLQAKAVQMCWPQKAPRHGLPSCARASGLESRGSGLHVERITLHASAQNAEPQLAVGSLNVERLGLVQPQQGPVQLNLHGVAIDAVQGCGLEQWLPVDGKGAAARNWAGCVTSGNLRLNGDNLVALGRGAGGEGGARQVPIVDFGPSQLSNLAIRRRGSDQPLAEVRDVHWRELRWYGGPAVQVADLEVRDFSGCLPPQGGKSSAQAPLCAQLQRLAFRGRQQLRFSPQLHIGGRVEVAGFIATQGGRKRIAIDSLGVDGLLLDKEQLVLDAGEVSGVSGCLPKFRLGDKVLSPCYQVGRVQMEREYRLPVGQVAQRDKRRRFRNLRVEGLQIIEPSFPRGLPAQLLNVELVEAEVLEVGAQLVQAENLHLKNLSSCLPRGYLRKVDHCLHVADSHTSGSLDLAQPRVSLAVADLTDVMIHQNAGASLLEARNVRAEQLQWANKILSFALLDVTESKLFRRRENAQEFSKRQWNTELKHLEVTQFLYSPEAKLLEIGTITAQHPHSMLARGRTGDYGAWEFLLGDEEIPRDRMDAGERRRELSREANRFIYRIGEVVVDHGSFLWLDDYNEYSARLPIRRINMLLRGISSESSDQSALILLNARPGGFGELQLAGSIDLLPSQKWDANLLGYIVAANLIPATPYMANLIGYKILQGQLDSELYIKINDNQVNALADMLLEKIKVRRVRDSDQLKVKSSLIPLGFALALLKDGKGDVKVKMPITGDLYDPKFNFSFIFSDLLQRAIMESLFAYFTPIGFYSLAKLAWARFRAVDFDSVEFAPGSKELSPSAQALLTESIAVMRDNPQARPGICGVSTALDMRALHADEVARAGASREAREKFLREPPKEIRDEMLALARKRSRQVQRYLLESGLDAEDFIQCAPDYIGNDFDQPRVEMSN